MRLYLSGVRLAHVESCPDGPDRRRASCRNLIREPLCRSYMHRGGAWYRAGHRRLASKVVDAATIIPSTDSGVSEATPAGLPVQRNEPVHVQVGHRARD